MTKQVDGQPEGAKDLIHIVAWGVALLLCSTLWMLLGWFSFLFPLIVFIYIQKFGWQNTNKHLFAAIPLAIIAGYFIQSVELIVFTILFLPAGYMIAHSAQREEKPWQAGLKGWIALCGLFFVFFSVLSANSEVSFFQAITIALSTGIDEALKQYSQSGSLSAENYEILESTLLRAKQTAPLILPAIFGSIFLLAAWTAVVVGNPLS